MDAIIGLFILSLPFLFSLVADVLFVAWIVSDIKDDIKYWKK